MSYLPKMFPFLMSYLSKAEFKRGRQICRTNDAINFDTVCQHGSWQKVQGLRNLYLIKTIVLVMKLSRNSQMIKKFGNYEKNMGCLLK